MTRINSETYAVRFWQHSEDVLSFANGVLDTFGVQQVHAACDTVGMGEAFHLDGVFWDGPEAVTAMPACISENALCALRVTIVAVVVPDLGACTPAGKTQIPFKAKCNLVAVRSNHAVVTYL